MQEDITELAKRVLSIPQPGLDADIEQADAVFTLCLEAAPKLAQFVLQLIAENVALRPDALAWREREARYQAEKQEILERMGK